MKVEGHDFNPRRRFLIAQFNANLEVLIPAIITNSQVGNSLLLIGLNHSGPSSWDVYPWVIILTLFAVLAILWFNLLTSFKSFKQACFISVLL